MRARVLLSASFCLTAFWVRPVSAQDKSAPAKPPTAPVDVRPIVERGLAALERDGLAWWKQRKCNGCHHGGYLLWSHYEAQRRGLNVDPQKLQAWTKQTLDLYLANLKDHQTKKNGHVEGMSILLGRPTPPTGDFKYPPPAETKGTAKSAETKSPAPTEAAKNVPPLQTVADLVAIAQNENGFFKYAGQGLKRPDTENDEATTLWAVLTLAPLTKENAAYATPRARALAWLKKTPAGPSNEALVLRLLVEHQFGEASRVKAMIETLKKQQNADGGWSWTKERPSEPFATGQTLYALARLELTKDDVAMQRGIAFLAAKQKPDGSWSSPSRKPNVQGNAIADYWGTAWATIGLVSTLPEKKAASNP